MIQQKKRSPKTESKAGQAGRKVQAGEHLSEGSGVRTDVSGPESSRPQKDDTEYSPSLPSREKIAKVLR